MKRRYLILLLMFVVPCLAAAEPANLDCTTAVTQQEMNACAKMLAEQLEAKLQTAIAAQAKGMSATSRQQFMAALNSWRQQRDRQCDAEARAELGLEVNDSLPSLFPLIYFGCHQRLTHERLNSLQPRRIK